jgi:hypothetical protein
LLSLVHLYTPTRAIAYSSIVDIYAAPVLCCKSFWIAEIAPIIKLR